MSWIFHLGSCSNRLSFKVREGRRAAEFPKLGVFLDSTAISDHNYIDMLYIKLKLNIIVI